jgi:hypothetical protein
MKSYWSRGLSDEELVERTRQHLSLGEKVRWVFLLMTAVFLGTALWFAPAAFNSIETYTRRSGGQWPWFFIGLAVGVSIGTVYLFLLLKAMASFFLFLNALIWSRRDRLLVKYYDEARAGGK